MFRKWLTCDLPDKCKECNFLPMCQGGCGCARFNQKEPTCTNSYYYFKDFMRLAYKDYMMQKNKL